MNIINNLLIPYSSLLLGEKLGVRLFSPLSSERGWR